MNNLSGHLKYAGLITGLILALATVFYLSSTLFLMHGKSIFGNYAVEAYMLFILVQVVGMIYLGTLFAAFFTPAFTTLAQHKWTSDTGRKFVTRAECASVTSTSSVTFQRSTVSYLRLTVNDYSNGKCIKRVLIGIKGAEFIGKFKNGFWFYTEDFLLHGSTGLICLDSESGEPVLKLKKREFRLVETTSRQSGIVTGKNRAGEEVKLDLKTIAV